MWLKNISLTCDSEYACGCCHERNNDLIASFPIEHPWCSQLSFCFFLIFSWWKSAEKNVIIRIRDKRTFHRSHHCARLVLHKMINSPNKIRIILTLLLHIMSTSWINCLIVCCVCILFVDSRALQGTGEPTDPAAASITRDTRFT